MTGHVTHHDDCGCLSAKHKARIATLEAALYPLVVGCLIADAREDAPEFVNDEVMAGMRALAECGRCDGTGTTDGKVYEDVPIPANVICPGCTGWGFIKHALAPAAEPQPDRHAAELREANATVLRLQDVIRRARGVLDRECPDNMPWTMIQAALRILRRKDGDPR